MSIRNIWTRKMGLPASGKDLKGLFGVSLYRNAIYLMLNNIMYALTGFFFWIAAARLYPAETVGLASSIIAASGLLALFSTLGLDYGLIRFLPSAGDKARRMINSCFTISGALAIAAAAIFLAGLELWSPALLPLRENRLYLGAFVVFVLVTVLHTFCTQSFIAARQSRLAMAQGWVAGFSRFIPLALLAAAFQDLGIFLSWGIAIIAAVLAGLIFFMPRAYPGYRPAISVDKQEVGRLLRFSFANYIANILWSMPNLLLPIMVVNLLGAEQNAYFYIGWSIAGIVFMIPTSTSSSLLAEASHNEQKLGQEVRRSLKLILMLLVPAIIFLLVLGRFILMLYGQGYAAESPELLWILAVSALPLSLNYIYFTIRRVEKRMASVMLLTGLCAAVTLGLSYALLESVGIEGAGLGWLAGQVLGAAITLPYLWRRFFRRKGELEV